MLKVKNKKAINRIALKSFKANRLRNLIAIVAISLTTILFTTLFTMGTGVVETFQQQTIRQAGGDGHAVLKYLSDAQFDKIKNHPLIKAISYDRLMADSVDNPELLKRRTELWYKDDTGLEFANIHLTDGHKPKSANEIIADTKTLDMLGLPHTVGTTVPLTYTIGGQVFTRDFTLSGCWESDPVFNVGQIYVSPAFVSENAEALNQADPSSGQMAGVVNAYILFNNSFNLDGKLHQVITESGFNDTDTHAPDYIASNVNWAYLSSNFSLSPSTILAAAAAVILIVFTGYLIIYNIFQISVIRDIRFYGLLKTIGTTGRQIRHILNRQAVMLSAVGIPIGLVIGFLTGKSLTPVLLSATNYSADNGVYVSLNPLIFMGAALFAIVTVFISTRKPGRVAASVSPIEAVRYTEGGQERKKQKKSTDGGKLYRMALSNLGRSRGRTLLVILSLSLSLVLLNTVFTLSRGLDMEKYVSRWANTDFVIAHADYFNYDFTGPENALSESFIQSVEAQPGFEGGGRVLGGKSQNIKMDAPSGQTLYSQNGEQVFASVYGLDTFVMDKLTLVEGTADAQKLASGGYIIAAYECDDYGVPYPDTAPFSLGQSVTLYDKNGVSHNYEVLAKAKVNLSVASDRSSWGYSFYLPSEVYAGLDPDQPLMEYTFDVSDSQEGAMETFLKRYTETEEPTMDYESRELIINEFESLRQIVLIVGGILTVIIGLIGVLNFVNSILTSIITRRREFAMLQSIGMTGKQLTKMLCLEGLYYALGTMLFSLILGVLFSAVILRGVTASLWFFSYHFIITPLLITYPILLILSALVPVISYRGTVKQSVVERLREAE
ncbi:ABC transporter permease [Eubacterium sp. 1001713B170207_170306_E7]|uniref:ABC transporter permease n=1 Tax=Eubacterium sp. 1001713B170207_170306_E7 TaxID=2787097 RepID=UPI001899982F|nr:ABC transporter permease [Eubacterium sp. 1001713B170207_170306_E7]